jgi:hypothetical protein
VKKGSIKPVRCAIYTRVSTDHGLEQDFNSLDAQHDAAQAFFGNAARANRVKPSFTMTRPSSATNGAEDGSCSTRSGYSPPKF